MFSVGSASKSCPSARHISVDNVVGVFGTKTVSLNYILL
jgi:hypothetical protein